MNENPGTCATCRTKPCQKSSPGSLDLCPYGIVYFNYGGGKFERREPTTPYRHLAKNLRHELHPVLSFVVNEVSQIDETLSLRAIRTDTAPGRILGATVLLDDTIQMITGVHEIHPMVSPENARKESVALPDVVRNKFAIYSLTGSARRTRGLTLALTTGTDGRVLYGVTYLEYLVAVLMDNAWKFSADGTQLEVDVAPCGAGLCRLRVSNVGKALPDDLDLFQMGVKGAGDSKGFGYGLFWARLLVDIYNEGLERTAPLLDVNHRQEVDIAGVARHTFDVNNIRVAAEDVSS